MVHYIQETEKGVEIHIGAHSYNVLDVRTKQLIRKVSWEPGQSVTFYEFDEDPMMFVMDHNKRTMSIYRENQDGTMKLLYEQEGAAWCMPESNLDLYLLIVNMTDLSQNGYTYYFWRVFFPGCNMMYMDVEKYDDIYKLYRQHADNETRDLWVEDEQLANQMGTLNLH